MMCTRVYMVLDEEAEFYSGLGISREKGYSNRLYCWSMCQEQREARNNKATSRSATGMLKTFTP